MIASDDCSLRFFSKGPLPYGYKVDVVCFAIVFAIEVGHLLLALAPVAAESFQSDI